MSDSGYKLPAKSGGAAKTLQNQMSLKDDFGPKSHVAMGVTVRFGTGGWEVWEVGRWEVGRWEGDARREVVGEVGGGRREVGGGVGGVGWEVGGGR